ncbi:MAG: hypothetical protein ISS50_06410 [Anaerolineae bacterium]|nr:hypothetical protein [Anaerolineae bacterium]
MVEKTVDMLLTEQVLTVTLREIEPVARQLLSYYDDLKHLSEEMRKFEEQYRLSSGDFCAKWKDGQLGDETDLFEWYACCDTYRRLVEKTRSRCLANQKENQS